MILQNLNLVKSKVNKIIEIKQPKIKPKIIVVTKTFTLEKIKPLLENGHMHFGENKTAGGIIIPDDDGTQSGIHPRWARVYAIGSKQEDVKVGQWILVSHGRWSRAFKIENEKEKEEVRMVDEDDILMISDDEPEENRKQAGYINTGGMGQAKVPG